MGARQKGRKGKVRRYKRPRPRPAKTRKKLRPPTGEQVRTTFQVAWFALRTGEVLTKHEGPATHWVSRAFADLVELINGLVN